MAVVVLQYALVSITSDPIARVPSKAGACERANSVAAVSSNFVTVVRVERTFIVVYDGWWGHCGV